jgi:hypothetical protein
VINETPEMVLINAKLAIHRRKIEESQKIIETLMEKHYQIIEKAYKPNPHS